MEILEKEVLLLYKYLLLNEDDIALYGTSWTAISIGTGLGMRRLYFALSEIVSREHVVLVEGVLSANYIRVFRRRKEEVGGIEDKKATAVSTGCGKMISTMNRGYTRMYDDEHFGLTDVEYSSLEKDEEIEIDLSLEGLERWKDNPKYLIFSYTSFNLQVAKNLSIFYNEYLAGVIIDEFADGSKFSYQTQKRNIAIEIAKRLHQGFPRTAICIDSRDAFNPRTGTLKSPKKYDLLSVLLGMESEGLLLFKSIKRDEPGSVYVRNSDSRYLLHNSYNFIVSINSSFIDYYNTKIVPVSVEEKNIGSPESKESSQIPGDSQMESMTVVISKDLGICNTLYPDRKYPISWTSARRKMIYTLSLNREGLPGPELARLFYKGNKTVLGATVKKINSLFRKGLKVEFDLIVSIVTGGYQLNPALQIDYVE